LPTATFLPEITSLTSEDFPSDANPMHFKGVGEGGITSVAGAVGNAVAHALKGFDVEITQLPLSPANLHAWLSEERSSR
jgi:carbon-monoxide dehydrogenase large subunit